MNVKQINEALRRVVIPDLSPTKREAFTAGVRALAYELEKGTTPMTPAYSWGNTPVWAEQVVRVNHGTELYWHGSKDPNALRNVTTGENCRALPDDVVELYATKPEFSYAKNGAEIFKQFGRTIPDLAGAPVKVHELLPMSQAEAKCVNWKTGAQITFIKQGCTEQVTTVLAQTGRSLEIFCSRDVLQQLKDFKQ